MDKFVRSRRIQLGLRYPWEEPTMGGKGLAEKFEENETSDPRESDRGSLAYGSLPPRVGGTYTSCHLFLGEIA